MFKGALPGFRDFYPQELAERAYIMEGGRIHEDAPPDKIFTNPSSERTRTFLKAILER